jgi:murein L,D-transpeptidase YcbB/YkuD
MVLASVLFASAAYADPVADALGARIDELQFGGDLHIGDARILMDQLLPSIYAERGFQPLWTDEGRIQELLEWLETAPAHGLDTADYHLADLKAQIAEARASRTPLAMADQDILLTEAFLLFGYHQVFGKVHPTGVDANINFKRRFLTEGGPINGAPAVIASDKPLAHHIAEHLGRAPIYEQFQGLLAQHREIAASGGWPTVPAGETLRAGDDDSRVAALRRRLVASGDLPPGADTASTHFNDPLATAVKSFQARHALGTDGVVGANTYAALNVPVETRIDQLRLTLERIRWVRVFFYERNGITWTARAMVGRAYRQTPIFRGRMQYMEINPTWTVPPGILRKDVLPAIKRDAGYLQAKNMSVIDRDGEVVDPTTVDWQAYSRGIPYSIRQEPGPKNALGEIKFIFPNEHFVFLHDTPSRNLFDRPERTFSSGCIRVDKPFELAQLLLNEPGKWNQETLGAVRDSRKTQRIRTPKGTSVLIT